MRNRLIKLIFALNRLELKQRAILAGSVLLVIVLGWLFIFHFPQQNELVRINEGIKENIKNAEELNVKRKTIEALAQDNTIAKLMDKYDRLKEEMRQLDLRIARYERRFIGEKELAQLLYSMLEKTEGVTIQNFSNVDYLKGATEGIISQEIQKNGEDSKSNGEKKGEDDKKEETSSLLPPIAQQAADLPSTRTQYRLVLKGDYFSIMNYLERIERLPWQLYWDKLDYIVHTYPEATAEIEFYTLQPSGQERKPQGAQSK